VLVLLLRRLLLLSAAPVSLSAASAGHASPGEVLMPLHAALAPLDPAAAAAVCCRRCCCWPCGLWMHPLQHSRPDTQHNGRHSSIHQVFPHHN
jgi:hypothetical protein